MSKRDFRAAEFTDRVNRTREAVGAAEGVVRELGRAGWRDRSSELHRIWTAHFQPFCNTQYDRQSLNDGGLI